MVSAIFKTSMISAIKRMIELEAKVTCFGRAFEYVVQLHVHTYQSHNGKSGDFFTCISSSQIRVIHQ